MDFKYTCEKEASDRNSFLINKYGKIPSYSLWREIDIEKENINTRYRWWNNQETKINSNIVINWKTYLYSLIKKDIKYEYCSKRAGNELQCDI